MWSVSEGDDRFSGGSSFPTQLKKKGFSSFPFGPNFEKSRRAVPGLRDFIMSLFKRFGTLKAGIGLGVLLAGAVATAGILAIEMPRFRMNEEGAKEAFRTAVQYYNHRNYGAAREKFISALEISPDFHLARKFLAQTHYYSGEWNEAMFQWDFIEQTAPGDFPLVALRNRLMHFMMGGYSDTGPYIYLKSYHGKNLKEINVDHPVDVHPLPGAGLYMLDYGSARLFRINPSGSSDRSWGGGTLDSFQGPVAMNVRQGRIYISDYSDDRVRVLNSDGRQIRSFGMKGSGEGEFHGPAGITSNENYLFVIDSGNKRILKFDLEGKYISQIPLDRTTHEVRQPYGIALLEDGSFYISDPGAGQIYHLDPEGGVTSELSHPSLQKPRLLSIHKDRLLIADEKAGVIIYHLKDNNWEVLSSVPNGQDPPVSLHGAYSVQEDDNGLLYIARYRSRRVEVLIPRGLKISNYDVHIENIEAKKFPGVAVFVRVKNRVGNNVVGLTKKEFMIFENDRRIGLLRSDNMQTFQKRLNLSIVVEQSDLFHKTLAGDLSAVMRSFLDPIRVVDKIHLIQAGQDSDEVYSGLHRRTLLRKMLGSSPSRIPNLGKGLYDGITLQLNKLGSRHILLVVSGNEYDGAFQQYDIERIIQYAKSHGISIHILSFQQSDDDSLSSVVKSRYQDLAKRTGGSYVFAYDETALSRLYEQMVKQKDERYILTYRSRNTRLPSDQPIHVRVEVRHLKTTGVDEGIYFTSGN